MIKNKISDRMNSSILKEDEEDEEAAVLGADWIYRWQILWAGVTWGDGQWAAAPGAGQVCRCGRHRCREDQADLRPCLQQTRVAIAIADHPRTHGLGHRPVSNLQGRKPREWI